MNTVGLYGLHRRPYRISAHARGECRLDGDDDIGIPRQHLFHRHGRHAAALTAGDIMRAEKLDGLYIDRTAEPGFQSARAARVVHGWPLRVRNLVDPAFDSFDRVIGVARKLLGLGLPLRQFTKLTINLRRCIKTAVEQNVRYAGFVLHTLRQRNVRVVDCADVENEIGFQLDQYFEIGRVAATRETSNFGLVAGARSQQGALRRVRVPRPAKQQFGRKCVEQERRRRPAGKNMLDLIGDRDGAPGSVGQCKCPGEAGHQNCGGEAGQTPCGG